MKYALRGIIRFLITAGLSLAVILAAAILFVQTGLFKGWLRAQIVNAVEGEINGRVRLDRVSGTIFTGVTLTGIEIGTADSPVISAGEVRIRYFLPALLRKTADITRVTIVKPRLALRQERDGTWNISRVFSSKKKTVRPPAPRNPLAGWLLRAGKVELAGTSVSLTDRAGKTIVDVPALSMTARGLLTMRKKGVEGTIDLDALTADGRAPVAIPVAASGKGSFGPAGIRVNYLDIAAGDSRGRVTGTLTPGKLPFIDARVNFTVVSFDDVRRFAPSVSFSSAAALTVDVRGTPSSFAAAAVISYGDLRVESSGTADIPRLRIAGISRIRNLHPEEVVPGCAGTKRTSCPSGDVNLDLTLDVDGDPFSAGSGTCTVTVLPSRIGPVSIATGTLELAAANGNAVLAADDFATSAGTFSVSGSMETAGLVKKGEALRGTFLVNGYHVDLAPAAGEMLKSDLNFGLTVGLSRPPGKHGVMALSGSFRASSSTVRDIAVAGAAADFSVQGETISVSALSVVSDALKLAARGTIGPRGKLGFSYSLAAADIGAVGHFVPSFKASGSITSTGTVTGTTSRPAVSGIVTGEDLRYGGFAAKTLSIEANVSPGASKQLPLGSVRLSAGELSAGKTPVKGITVNAASDGGRAVFTADLAKDDERKVHLAGETAFTGQGHARIMLSSMEISAGPVTWSNTRPVRATLSPGGVTILSFDLAYSSQALSVSGQWENRGNIHVDVSIRDIDLSTVAETAGAPLPLAGIVRSFFTVRGRTAAPEVNGTLFVSTGTIGGFPFEHIVSTVAYRDGRTRLLLSVAGGGREVLTASGTIPAGTGGGLDLRLAARDLDLSLLSGLTPAIEQASGRVSAVITAQGNVREPEVNGELVLAGGTLGIRGTGVTYRDLQVRLRFAGDTLYIDRLSLASEEGKAAAGGSIRFKGLMPESGSVDITARRFKAMGTRTFSALLDADLNLRPQGDGSLLSGKVVINKAEVNIPKASPLPGGEVTVIETGPGGEQRVVKAPARTPVPLVSRLAMRVEAEVPGDAWVRGDGLNAEVQGKLLLARNAGEPLALSGDISTVRGTYQFRGKLLTIDRGRLAFTGEPRIDPELNAQASAIVDNITIYVTLRGTVSQPQISLRSEPPRDESDLVAYLVFGRPLSRLSESENRLVQRAAVQALGGLAVTGLKDFLGQDLAPDVVNVYSGQESGFSVGKYISNRLFVRYEWRFGLEEVRQTVLNVQLNRHFALNSQVGSEKTSGVDLIWTTNY